MSYLYRLAIIACVCLVAFIPRAVYSIGLPSLPIPPVPKVPKVPNLPIPDITQLLNGEPITTSLSDAVTAIPFLNDYEPGVVRGLAAIQPDSNGAFNLVAGSYWFNGRSYCLHAGKHAPTTGNAYLLAPLKGPRAPIIEDILRNSVAHLEIPQPTVQQLIWAILARAKLSDTSTQLQLAAAKLLKPAEILQLNGGAVGFIPADKLNDLLAKVPDPLKPVIEAENSLRGMLTSNATYQDMERVAVLPGLPEATTTAQAQLRWSYDPHGFFIWYTPHGYPLTTTHLDVPGAVTEKLDQLGRVSALQDNKGDTVTATYSGAGSLKVDGDAQTQFYHLQSLRFVWHDEGTHGTVQREETWPVNDLVMVGIPNGKGKTAAIGDAQHAQSLYDSAAGLRGQFSGLLRQIHGQDAALAELMALAEFRTTLKSAASTHGVYTAAVEEALDFPVNAWESALAQSVGGRVAADVRAGVDAPFNPSNNTSVPQNGNAQRLAQSPAPGGGNNPPNPPPGQCGQNVAAGFSYGGKSGLNPNLIDCIDSGHGASWQVTLGQNGQPWDPFGGQPWHEIIDGQTLQNPDGSWSSHITVTIRGEGGITITRSVGWQSGSTFVSSIGNLIVYHPGSV